MSKIYRSRPVDFENTYNPVCLLQAQSPSAREASPEGVSIAATETKQVSSFYMFNIHVTNILNNVINVMDACKICLYVLQAEVQTPLNVAGQSVEAGSGETPLAGDDFDMEDDDDAALLAHVEK